MLGTLSLKGGRWGLGPMVDCPYPYFNFLGDFLKLKQINHNPLNDERTLKIYQNTIIHHFKGTFQETFS